MLISIFRGKAFPPVSASKAGERTAAFGMPECGVKGPLYWRVETSQGEREFSNDAHWPRMLDQGAAFSSLTRRHSCGSPCRTPAGAQSRAPGVLLRRALQGCRPLLARGASLTHRTVSNISGGPSRTNEGVEGALNWRRRMRPNPSIFSFSARKFLLCSKGADQ